MKAKTIKAHLRWKINHWLETITDEDVRKLAAKNVIVTGGSIVSMLTKEKVNDYDVYFRTVEAASAVANYYVNLWKGGDKGLAITVETTPATLESPAEGEEATVPATPGTVKIMVKSQGIVSEGGVEEYVAGPSFEDILELGDDTPGALLDADDKPKYLPVFISSNAITLSHGVQLVVRFIGEPEAIHKFYDFIHCTCFWKSWDGDLVLPAAALEAIITKELRYVGSLYPLCSIIRIRKFVARGWQINAGQILKMCVQLGNFNLMDPAVLEDQLTGVDAFYFQQVIERLKEKQLEDGSVGKPIDSAYLMTIIDRMF